MISCYVQSCAPWFEVNKYVKCYLWELRVECTDWPQCFIAINGAAAAVFITGCYRKPVKGTGYFFTVKETNLIKKITTLPFGRE